jgi:hypothetical protein
MDIPAEPAAEGFLAPPPVPDIPEDQAVIVEPVNGQIIQILI